MARDDLIEQATNMIASHFGYVTANLMDKCLAVSTPMVSLSLLVQRNNVTVISRYVLAVENEGSGGEVLAVSGRYGDVRDRVEAHLWEDNESGPVFDVDEVPESSRHELPHQVVVNQVLDSASAHRTHGDCPRGNGRACAVRERDAARGSGYPRQGYSANRTRRGHRRRDADGHHGDRPGGTFDDSTAINSGSLAHDANSIFTSPNPDKELWSWDYFRSEPMFNAWLAAHDREVAARALEEAAGLIEVTPDSHASDVLSVERVCERRAEDWLLDRAQSLRAGGDTNTTNHEVGVSLERTRSTRSR